MPSAAESVFFCRSYCALLSVRCAGGLEDAQGLLAAAHQYQLPRLVAMCEQSLCASLRVSNAAERLVCPWHCRACSCTMHGGWCGYGGRGGFC